MNLKKRIFYNNKTFGIETSFPQNLDIDNIYDLNLARTIIKKKKKLN